MDNQDSHSRGSSTAGSELRILIIANHASLRFGGEASLPFYYFRFLRERNYETWLLVHERTRSELQTVFREDMGRIHFTTDTFVQLFLWRCGEFLPHRVSYFTFRLLVRLLTQWKQRRIARKLIRDNKINVVHQPIPVSPREPSLLHSLGVPVVVGPMNGGMKYPPGFRKRERLFVRLIMPMGDAVADLLNILVPGKRWATTLIVANRRTRAALPASLRGTIVELTENGVDLSNWTPKRRHPRNNGAERKPHSSGDTTNRHRPPTRFAYIGRLIDWKGVDILIRAFDKVQLQWPAELDIIGEGPERPALEKLVTSLGFIASGSRTNGAGVSCFLKEACAVRFLGWLSRVECAEQLKRIDVLVLPSLLECGGAVVLEAMASAVPVIATNWGGPADYLDETCGILVDPESPQAFMTGLQAAMIKLAQQPDLRYSMGTAGHRKVSAKYDWNSKIDTITDIYQDSVKRFSARPTRRQLPQN